MGAAKPNATDLTPRHRGRSGPQRSNSGRREPDLVEILGVGSVVSVSGSRDERIARIAELQRGHISREQLYAVGLTDAAIARRLASGRLIRVHPSVYAVRPALEVPLGREAAALLACGPNAFLSHASAAALWGLCDAASGPVDVTVLRDRHRKTPGIRGHRSGCLRESDVRVEQGLPATSPARTLLDRAATHTVKDIARELDEALVVLRLLRPDELADLLARSSGHHGAAILRRLLERRTHETITQSEAERLFLNLVRKAGLPEPETQVRIAGYRVDFLWRNERVVFEIDGYRFHTSRTAFDRDRRKDLALKSARYDPNRVSRDQVKHQPLLVLAHVVAALERRAVR